MIDGWIDAELRNWARWSHSEHSEEMHCLWCLLHDRRADVLETAR